MVFVTWHLADSIPHDKLSRWKEEREAWMRLHPRPWDEPSEAEYHERFSDRMESWLDAGMGSCLLRRSDIAAVVLGALLHFDGQRYDVDAAAVMPNHVHVLFALHPEHRLEKVLQSWKGFTAREIHRKLGSRGTLWQEGYWDRLIRSERHLRRVREYIQSNPARAGLSAGEYLVYSRELRF